MSAKLPCVMCVKWQRQGVVTLTRNEGGGSVGTGDEHEMAPLYGKAPSAAIWGSCVLMFFFSMTPPPSCDLYPPKSKAVHLHVK